MAKALRLFIAIIAIQVSFLLITGAIGYIALSPHLPTLRSTYTLVFNNQTTEANVSQMLPALLLEGPGTAVNTETAQLETTSENNESTTIKEEGPSPNPDTIPASGIKMPKYEEEYGRIIIPTVDIDLPLIFGDSDNALKKGAGQYAGTRIPGFNSPILIAGHNTDKFFLPLKDISLNDEIRIQTEYGDFVYKVYETDVIHKNDFDLELLSQPEEILILYTCYPFLSLGFKVDRYFVFANKISGPVVGG